MLFNRSRADRLLAERGVDAVVATSRENVEYVSGHQNPTHTLMKASLIFAVYAPAATPAASAIIPTLEVETFLASRSWVTDVHLFGFFARAAGEPAAMDAMGRAGRDLLGSARRHAGPIDALVAALRERGLEAGTIALDESGLSPEGWNAVVAALPGARIVPAGALLWSVRVVKTPLEIERLRAAARITEDAVREAVAGLEPGMRDRDIARAYHASLVRNDAMPSFTMFASGSGTGQPHMITSDRVVEAGDLVRWDVGCTYQSYHSDTARAITLGEPTDRQKRTWDLLVRGVEDAVALARPGADPADLFAAAMAPVRGAGLPDCERFHCGHGIGIAIYDPPVITAGDQEEGQRSASLLTFGRDEFSRCDLRVDVSDEPVAELRRVYDFYAPLVPYYVERASNHEIGRYKDFLKRNGHARSFGPRPPVTRGPHARTGGR